MGTKRSLLIAISGFCLQINPVALPLSFAHLPTGDPTVEICLVTLFEVWIP